MLAFAASGLPSCVHKLTIFVTFPRWVCIGALNCEQGTIDRGSGLDKKTMEWKLFATVFASIFIAELADKTQLVTLLFAADKAVNKWIVFLGSASALVLASAIGVLAGGLLSQFINMKAMSIVAGTGFILIGAWTLSHGLNSA